MGALVAAVATTAGVAGVVGATDVVAAELAAKEVALAATMPVVESKLIVTELLPSDF